MGPRSYDKEFKQNAIELYKSGKKARAVCRDLGIPESTFDGWISKYKTHGAKAFPGSGNPQDPETAKLKKRLAETELERDILKKALAIFSQQQ